MPRQIYGCTDCVSSTVSETKNRESVMTIDMFGFSWCWSSGKKIWNFSLQRCERSFRKMWENLSTRTDFQFLSSIFWGPEDFSRSWTEEGWTHRIWVINVSHVGSPESSPNKVSTKALGRVQWWNMAIWSHCLLSLWCFSLFCLERDVFIQYSDHQALLEAEKRTNRCDKPRPDISVIHPKRIHGNVYFWVCRDVF